MSTSESIPMLLTCPTCRARHIDVGEFRTKPHHTHACQQCGHCWRPAVVATVGVQYLPGFKNEKDTALVKRATAFAKVLREVHAETHAASAAMVEDLVEHIRDLESCAAAGNELVGVLLERGDQDRMDCMEVAIFDAKRWLQHALTVERRGGTGTATAMRKHIDSAIADLERVPPAKQKASQDG